MDIIIRNGTIVTDSKTCVADLAIKDGIIVKIDTKIADKAESEINAYGKYVFPGFIDPHTHLELPITDEISSTDDFYTGTVAAAFGGTTTIIDYIVPFKGQSLKDAFDLWKSKASGKAVIDYAFHMTISDPTDLILEQIKLLPDVGITSIKCFTAYINRFMMSDDKIYRVLEESKDTKILACMHCENGYVLDYKIKQLIKEGKLATKYHPLSRPDILESEAISRVIDLARLAQAPIFIAHLSTAGGLFRIKDARDKGYPVSTETCPQYLMLDEEVYNLEGYESAKYVCSPPIRHKDNIYYLWEGVLNGDIELFATDHCPFNFNKEKQAGRDNFTKIPNGLPGIEDRVNILFSEGVLKRKLDLKKFVSLVSTMPAKTFGLYPQKGSLNIGTDADVVIYDPDFEWTISAETHHQQVDYNVYEGLKVKGKPDIVISRGKIIVNDDKFSGQKGAGVYLRRKSSHLFTV